MTQTSRKTQPRVVTKEEADFAVGIISQQQRLFVENLISDPSFNVHQAAKKAGYKNPTQSAVKLLANPSIAQLIGKHIHERTERTKITADRVLQELARIAFLNPKRALDGEGHIQDLKDMTDDIACAIREINVTYEETSKSSVLKRIYVKFWDKQEALGVLAKHVGILRDLPTVNLLSINWHELYATIQKAAGVLPDGSRVTNSGILKPPQEMKQIECQEVIDGVSDQTTNDEIKTGASSSNTPIEEVAIDTTDPVELRIQELLKNKKIQESLKLNKEEPKAELSG